MSSICHRQLDIGPIRPINTAHLSLMSFGNNVQVVSGEPTFQFADGNGVSRTGWRWNGHTLTISVGGPGNESLFLHQTPTGITVSISLSEIWTRHHLRIDPVAWTVFQITGMYLGTDTPFADVLALSAGSTAEWRNGHLARSEPAPHRKDAHFKEEVVAAEFERLLRYAVARDAPKQAAFSNFRVA